MGKSGIDVVVQFKDVLGADHTFCDLHDLLYRIGVCGGSYNILRTLHGYSVGAIFPIHETMIVEEKEIPIILEIEVVDNSRLDLYQWILRLADVCENI